MERKPSEKVRACILLVITLLVKKSFGDSCPTPPTKIEPSLSVKVDFDKKSGLYNYSYTLSNGKAALIPIRILRFKVTNPKDIFVTPNTWLGSNSEDDGVVEYFTWAASIKHEILPGGSQTGFVLKSLNGPGVIPYYALGKTGMRVGTPAPGDADDEPTPDCEGFYDDKSVLDSMVSGITQGPVGNSRISVDLELKDSKGERDRSLVSPYEDKGAINVLLKGPKDLNTKEIDFASFQFGVGKAPLISSKILGESRNVLLQFDIQKVEIECGRDRILFLTGKTKDGKDIFGGASVKTKNCDKRPMH